MSNIFNHISPYQSDSQQKSISTLKTAYTSRTVFIEGLFTKMEVVEPWIVHNLELVSWNSEGRGERLLDGGKEEERALENPEPWEEQ